MIVRTVTAFCDGPPQVADETSCYVSLELEAESAEPLGEIESLGWAVRLMGPETFTFCPLHAGQAKR